MRYFQKMLACLLFAIVGKVLIQLLPSYSLLLSLFFIALCTYTFMFRLKPCKVCDVALIPSLLLILSHLIPSLLPILSNFSHLVLCYSASSYLILLYPVKSLLFLSLSPFLPLFPFYSSLHNFIFFPFFISFFNFFRLLGAKVGKRVYWPGSGLDIVEYDLLEVGDDVVFGSRSVVLTSSAVRSAPVKFESGSMVADR